MISSKKPGVISGWQLEPNGDIIYRDTLPDDTIISESVTVLVHIHVHACIYNIIVYTCVHVHVHVLYNVNVYLFYCFVALVPLPPLPQWPQETDHSSTCRPAGK